MKFINFLVLVVLVFISSVAYAQNGLDLLEKERTQLIIEYEANTKKGIKKKINKKEDEILLFIKEKGFEVTIKTFFEYSEVEVKDELYLGKTIAILKNNDKLIIFERLKTGHFKVRTKDNKIGYIYHTGFSPSVEEYPLSILVPKTTTKETMTQKTTSTIYIPKTGSTSTKGCSTVQCSGTTQKGSRCRNKTTNCGGRCHLH